MFGTEASLAIAVREAGTVLRHVLLRLHVHRCPYFDIGLFRTFKWKLSALFQALEKSDESPDGFHHNHYLAKQEVKRITDKFEIGSPEIGADTVAIWLHYMALLIDACSDGNLNAARNIMEDENLRFRDRRMATPDTLCDGGLAPPPGLPSSDDD